LLSSAEVLGRCFGLLEGFAEVLRIDSLLRIDFPLLRSDFHLLETDLRFLETFRRVLEAVLASGRRISASRRPLGPSFGLWETFRRVLEAGFWLPGDIWDGVLASWSPLGGS